MTVLGRVLDRIDLNPSVAAAPRAEPTGEGAPDLGILIAGGLLLADSLGGFLVARRRA